MRALFSAVFLSFCGPLSAASSSTYETQCQAWNPSGAKIYSGSCRVAVGLAGMSETLVYQVDLPGAYVRISLTGAQCDINGRACRQTMGKTLRFSSDDGSVLEFAGPPRDGF